MNKLPTDKRVAILNLLIKGVSVTDITKTLNVNKRTVLKLLVDAGRASKRYHDYKVRQIDAEQVQCDEMWSFCHTKDRNLSTSGVAPPEAGDVWIWTSIDTDSRLLINWDTSPNRGPQYATRFMRGLQARLTKRVQLSTDGLRSYLTAVDEAFRGDVDYAQLVKHYNKKQRPRINDDDHFSPPEQEFTTKTLVLGNPIKEKVNTSYVERHNRTMRMAIRRLTRSVDAHSKKLENHRCAIAFYAVWYNFIRVHSSLKTTPAVAAGLSDAPMSMHWMIDLIEGRVQTRIVRKRLMRKVVSKRTIHRIARAAA